MRNLSVRLLVLACALSLGLGAVSVAQPPVATASPTRIDRLEREIEALRAETWRWQALMRKPRTPSSFTERHAESPRYIGWVRDLWHRRAVAAKRQAANPPHRNDWLCIQRHESHPAQGWGTYTGNGYYGGLQMDHPLPAFRTAPSCCGGRARRTVGPQSSRCGSPSGHIATAAASTPGPTRPAPAA